MPKSLIQEDEEFEYFDYSPDETFLVPTEDDIATRGGEELIKKEGKFPRASKKCGNELSVVSVVDENSCHRHIGGFHRNIVAKNVE